MSARVRATARQRRPGRALPLDAAAGRTEVDDEEQDRLRLARSYLKRSERLARGPRPFIEECDELTQKALEIFRAKLDFDGVANTLKVVVLAAARQSEGARPAMDLVNEEMEEFARAGNVRGQAVMKLASAYINCDRHGSKKRQEALVVAEEALEIFRMVGDQKTEAECLALIASILVRMCDKGAGPRVAHEAVEYANAALKLLQDLGDLYNEAHALYILFLAKLYTEMPIKQCLKHANEAAYLFQEEGCPEWQVVVYNAVANAYSQRGQGTEAVAYARMAHELSRDMGMDLTSELSTATSLISAHLGEGDDDEALRVAKDLVAAAKAAGDQSLIAQALVTLSKTHEALEQLGDALDASCEAVAIFRELGNTQGECFALFFLGDLHLLEGKADDALAAYQDSHACATTLRDDRHCMQCQFSMLRCHLLRHDNRSALEAAFEAQSLASSHGSIEQQGMCHLNLAAIHMQCEDFAMAHSEIEWALTLFNEHQGAGVEAKAHYFFAEYYARTKQHQQAVEAATSARNAYRKAGDLRNEIHMLDWIANTYVDMAQQLQEKGEGLRTIKRIYASALKAGKEMLGMALKYKQSDHPKCLAYQTVAAVQHLTGRSEEALRNLQTSLDICREGAKVRADRAKLTCTLCTGLVMKATFHHNAGKEAEAMLAAKDALQVAQTSRDGELLEQVTGLLARLNPPEVSSAKAPARDEPTPEGPPQHLAESVSISQGVAAYSGPSAEELLPRINLLAQQLLSVDELENDRPLMDAGMDSLNTVQFRNALQRNFPGVPMPASLVFDHPTVAAVARNIVDELKAAHEAGRPLV